MEKAIEKKADREYSTKLLIEAILNASKEEEQGSVLVVTSGSFVKKMEKLERK
ncbi:MAG: hypothetical protein QXD11_02655 [Candidatus Micrarchaeaceae archaeon]